MFCFGSCLSRRRKPSLQADRQFRPRTPPKAFPELVDGTATAEYFVQEKDSKQSFVHLGDDRVRTPSPQDRYPAQVHPAWRTPAARNSPSPDCSPRRHQGQVAESPGMNRSSPDHSRGSPDSYVRSPPMVYTPEKIPPVTPPSHISSRRIEPMNLNNRRSSRFDVSPLQSEDVIRADCQVPVSFLAEMDAQQEAPAATTPSAATSTPAPPAPLPPVPAVAEESAALAGAKDQSPDRSDTVSPLQNTPTPFMERLLADSQKSSRNVSPVSAITVDSSVIVTYPSATPVYRPRPFSRYNPYRPALEPAGSKNWPLENLAIPEDSAVSASSPQAEAGQEPSSHTPWNSPGRCVSPTSSATGSTYTNMSAMTASGSTNPMAVKISHPELDSAFLADFHRRRRRQQKAKQLAQGQKRKQHACPPNTQGDHSIKSPNRSSQAEMTVIPMPEDRPRDGASVTSPFGKMRPQSAILKATTAAAALELARAASKTDAEKAKQQKRRRRRRQKQQQQQQQQRVGLGLPPRLPSKSGKPSQSPDAYERARRISGLHELVGCDVSLSDEPSSDESPVKPTVETWYADPSSASRISAATAIYSFPDSGAAAAYNSPSATTTTTMATIFSRASDASPSSSFSSVSSARSADLQPRSPSPEPREVVSAKTLARASTLATSTPGTPRSTMMRRWSNSAESWL